MRNRRHTSRLLLTLGGVLVAMILSPASSVAQDIPLAQLLPDLLLREIILLRGSAGPPHQAHFSPIEANDPTNPVVAIVEAFNNQIATQFATFPLGSSTGGFTYELDETLGTFRRNSRSFGPSFGERALTIGRRKLSVGFNYQRTSYDTLEGQNLADGSIKFYLRHQDCCGFADRANLTGFMVIPDGTRLIPPFEGDVVEAELSLDAVTQTTAIFANYGMTDRWDIGLAVPLVRVSLDAQVEARILRLVTETAPDVHTFQTGSPDATLTVVRSGRSSGLGDITIRSKYQLFRAAGRGLAMALDVRLPTGDENNLLGAGGTHWKMLLVASDDRGRFGYHVNTGYTAATGTVAAPWVGPVPARVPDEINYSGGFEFVASPRLTLMGDLLGRSLRGAGRLDVVSKRFEYNDPSLFVAGLPGPGCGGFGGPTGGFTCTSAFFDEFDPRPGNLTLLLGTSGLKFNFAGNLLISGSVLFPLTNAGLRSRVTMALGIDYAF
jgi:hypothetical protein